MRSAAEYRTKFAVCQQGGYYYYFNYWLFIYINVQVLAICALLQPHS